MSRFRVYTIDATRTANQSLEENFKVDEGYHFLLKSLTGTHTSPNYKVRFSDSITKYWSDKKINNPNIIGVSTDPFILPEPKFIPAGSIVYYDIEDYSGTSQTIQICMIGEEIEKEKLLKPLLNKKFRAYVIDVSLTGKQSKTNQKIDIDITANFYCSMLTGNSTGIYKINLRDSQSNRLWSEKMMRNDNIIGTAQKPFVLPKPILIPANATLYYDITDLSGADNTVQIVLLGEEVIK